MLLKNEILKAIKSGEISLALRKWKRPYVKAETLIKTAVGRVEVVSISETDTDEITPMEAAKAGFGHLEDLQNTLNSRQERDIYKIEVQYHSPDTRIELRKRDSFRNDEFKELRTKLERLDAYSRRGTWTSEIPAVIRDRSRQKAVGLDSLTGLEKDWFKRNVRKLKNPGLTVSHHPGYTLSPRGRKFLKKLDG